jgi:nucleoside-diphosphate-sugar epimerase
MVYGEEEPHMLGLLLKLLRLRLLPVVQGGVNRLHLVYVKDVAAAAVMALRDDRFLGSAFNIADEDVLSVREIFSILRESIGAPALWNLPDVFTGLVARLPYCGRRVKFILKDRVYDISRIKSLGYHSSLPAAEALAKSARALMKIIG